MKLPAITKKQEEILQLLYRYRFIDSRQIELLMHHKDRKRIGVWLKDLREKEYIDWHYDATQLETKKRPAIYYLALNGIRHLRSLDEYPYTELQKRYKESKRKESFIDRCVLVADCCVKAADKSDGSLQYECILPADYISLDRPYHYLTELNPHLYVIKIQEDEVTRYVFEIFDQTLPRYKMRKRLNDYLEFLDENDESHVALLVGATMPDFLYIKRRVRRLVEEYEVQPAQLRVTILDKLRFSGMMSEIWEDIS